MRTFRDIQNCEGYYYNVETGDILRNVGPGQTGCWAQGSWVKVSPDRGLDVPQFELVTADISAPFEAVQREIELKYGRAAGRFINRQTALQPDGTVVTEEATAKKAD
jgi:hypothetical protein